jgi:hypothetical protein
MARPHIEPFCDRDVAFRNMTLPGLGRGFRYKMLSLDNETGACSMTVQLDSGYTRKPGFSWSEYEMLITEGSLKIDGKFYGKGHYFYVPAGYSLGEMTTDGAVLMLMYNTGEPSHVESREHHPLAMTHYYHDVSSYDDIPWTTGGVTRPTVATGCLVKLLNFNPVSHAITFLYCMTPNFSQDNISYHDCAEESYHIWGTSWMMQFGEIPTGGYFWRPAYINHGAFSSGLGCIALGRTDSKLYNHFHYNPWTTPVENQERSAARLAKRDPLLYKWTFQEGHNHPHGPEDFEDTMIRRGENGKLIYTGYHNHKNSHPDEQSHSHGDFSHSHAHGHSHDHGDGHHHHHD